MLERYRTLGAMAALREFTVADLARFSEVKPGTVRTVVQRNKHLLEERGKETTGSRGGSFVRYRLAPGAEAELIGELKEIERVGAIREAKHEEEAEGLPTELIAAEYTVLTEFPATDDPDQRRRLLELARTSLDDVMTDAKSGGSWGPEVEAHRRILDFLIRLSEKELAAKDDTEANRPLAELFKEFVWLSLSTQLTDERIIEQVHDRLLDSPLNPSRSLKIDKVVMVRDTEQKDNRETRRVEETLELAIPSGLIESAPLSALPRLIEQFSPAQTLYVLLLNVATRSKWSRALSEIHAAARAGDELVVFSDRFEPTLANEVHELRGDYVTVEGLSRDGIVGAISQHLQQASLQKS